jgi:hypothetical protein
MKTGIQIRDELDSNGSSSVSRLLSALGGKLLFKTATLSSAAASILLLTFTAVARGDDLDKVEHVLLISVDGMHQSDLAWYVQTHPNSTLAMLMAQGINYSNASTPFPSDSFPGMVGQVTGGNPATTGIYYDDTWNHAVFPAGTKNCVGPAPGGEVAYTEADDINLGALDAGSGDRPSSRQS